MTLYPNGNGNNGIPNVSGASTHWQAVSDYGASDNTAYIWAGSGYSGNRTDYYATQNHGLASGTINSVSANIRCAQTSGSGSSAQTYLRLGSLGVSSVSWTVPSSYTSYSNTFARPGGGSWSWIDIDNLWCGVSLYRASGSTVRCTLVWVVVDFNA
jgi:hypothetical protein